MIPVQELWDGFGRNFACEFFVMLRGYIDESYSSESSPRMFSLTCVIAKGNEWPWIEMAWQKCLEETNASLILQGRRPISRYHSADLNNFRNEFEDWNPPERLSFCQNLIKIFSRHEWGYEGYLINLQELIEVWPETTPDPKAFAYDVLLKMLMIEMGTGISTSLAGGKITLFHERCPYDATFLNSFNEFMDDPTFSNRQCFTTIAPMGWEDCIPLQPADLVAYENFKEGYRKLPTEKPRDMRMIFKELISLESFVPHLKRIDREHICKLKEMSDKRRRATLH